MCALRIQLKAATNRLLAEREREVNINKQIQELKINERTNKEKQQKKINSILNNFDRYTLSTENEKIKRKIKEKESLLAQLTIEIQTIDQNEASHTNTINAKLESAQSMLEYMQNKYQSLLETKGVAEDSLKQLKDELDALNAQIESSTKKTAKLQKKENEYQENYIKQKAKEALRNQKIEEQKKEIFAIDDKIEAIKNEIVNVQNECKKKQQENQATLGEANRQLKESIRVHERLQLQRDKLQNKVFDLQGQLSFVSSELKHLAIAKNKYTQTF